MSLLFRQDYLESISNQSRLALTSEDKEALFGNIQDIYHFNRYGSHKHTNARTGCALVS